MFINQNANLFNDLATLCEAGISVSDAAKKINIVDTNKLAWNQVISDLESGKQLNITLAKNKLINPYEQEIISVAEFSGRLPQGIRAIAHSYDKRRQRVSKLKTKLYFPFSVLIIAILASAILTIANTPDVNVFSVFIRSFFWIGLAIILTRLILKLMLKDACSWLKMAVSFSNNHWYQMQLEQIIFGALLWQVSSGIDFKTGFTRTAKLLNNPVVGKKLKQISHFCGQGKTVIESINQSRLAITDDFKQILLTAEQSGQWQTSIERFLTLQQHNLDLRIDSAFEWAPRIYYGLISLIAISVIL